MKRHRKRGILLTIWMAVLLFFQSAAASGVDQMPELDQAKEGTLSVTLSCHDQSENPVSAEGVTLEIFKVAELSVINGGASNYALTEPFTHTQIIFAGMSASASHQAAKDLEAVVNKKQLSGEKCVTDAEGKAVFQGLSHGMYLAVMKKSENTTGKHLLMDPYLVSVPLAEKQDGSYQWNYIVSSYPKSEVISTEKNGSIIVTKKTSLQNGNDTMMLTMTDAVFYFGLFEDAAGTRPYGADFMKAVHLRNASAGTVVYENLPEGTYYVFETDSGGTPIQNGETVTGGLFPYTCVVEGNGNQKVEFTPQWEVKEGRVVINNVYPELPEGYYYEPEISITKRVLEGDRKIYTSETFYAGIFTEENGEYILNQVVELKQNGTVKFSFYIQITEDTPATKYWIFETDAQGNRIDPDTFPYEVEGEGAVELSDEKTEAEITLINRKIVEESEMEKTESGTSSSAASAGNGVRTGDETPILLYLGLMAAAAVLVIGLLTGKRVRRRMKN